MRSHGRVTGEHCTRVRRAQAQTFVYPFDVLLGMPSQILAASASQNARFHVGGISQSRYLGGCRMMWVL